MGLFSKEESTKDKIMRWGSAVGKYCVDSWHSFNDSSYVTSFKDKASDAAVKVSSVSSTTAYLAKSALYQEPWTEVCDGLLLGGMPIDTKIFNFGDHGRKLIQACKAKERPLSKVYSIGQEFELKGKGLVGFKPVDNEFWKSKKVSHQVIQMQNGSGKIVNKTLHTTSTEILKVVNEMQASIGAKKSVLVHCNNGQNRSLVIATCYLLKHNADIKSVTDALAFIYKKRTQVGVSMAELELIEVFRANYAANKAALNISSKKFEPLRQSWTKTLMLNNPLVQVLLFEGALRLLGLDGPATPHPSTLSIFFSSTSEPGFLERWGTRIAGVLAIGFNQGAHKVRASMSDYSYQHLEKQFSTFSESEKIAVAAGIESAEGFRAWCHSFREPKATWHYPSYLAGRRAKLENDPICDQVAKEVQKIRNSKKP